MNCWVRIPELNYKNSIRLNPSFPAFQTFGSGGKLAVELCMIGFLLGTCTAFFVVIGDLAPPIVSHLTGLNQSDNLRTVLMIGNFERKIPVSVLANPILDVFIMSMTSTANVICENDISVFFFQGLAWAWPCRFHC